MNHLTHLLNWLVKHVQSAAVHASNCCFTHNDIYEFICTCLCKYVPLPTIRKRQTEPHSLCFGLSPRKRKKVKKEKRTNKNGARMSYESHESLTGKFHGKNLRFWFQLIILFCLYRI